MKQLRTTIVVLLVGTMALQGGAASAGKPRTETWAYESPAVAAQVQGVGAMVCGGSYSPSNPGVGCVFVGVGVDERYLQIEFEDATGLPVPFSVTQEGNPKTADRYCGATPGPVKIAPGRTVHIHVYAAQIPAPVGAPNAQPCPGVGTQGKIHLTFWKTKPAGGA